MKSKIRGNKKTAYVLLGAGALGLTGIAFSAWVITYNPQPETLSNITVSVGNVEERNITISDAMVTDSDLSFDASSGDTTAPITAGDGSKEDLDFAIKFSIDGALKDAATFNDYYGGFSVELNVLDGENQEGSYLQDAVSNSQIVLPIVGKVNYAKPSSGLEHTASYNEESAAPINIEANFACDDAASPFALDVELTFHFYWGSAFNSTNPGFTTDTSREVLDSIKSALTSLKNASNAQLQVVLTPFLSNTAN